MKRSSSDLKALSRETLNRQWGLPIGAFLLIFICSIILTMVITRADESLQYTQHRYLPDHALYRITFYFCPAGRLYENAPEYQ